jgi:hypothetical protein
MKLDKETVVKHQFWFLLGGYLLVWFIAVLWLKFAAGGEIKKAEKAYKDNKDRLAKAQQRPINPNTFIPPWVKFAQVFDGHKRVIWGEAWELQKDMFDWPWRDKDMSTPQAEITQDDREDYKRKLYPDEIKAVKDWMPRVLGPVQLEGGFDDIFKPKKWDETPTREECWLAQEDYWVKRELLYVIGGAVAWQAHMEPVPIDEKKEPMPEGVRYRFRFRNENWELTLHLKPNADKLLVIAGDSTIKNIQPSQHPQSLTSAKGSGIVFNVTQDRTSAAFEVRGEPVPWNKEQRLDKADYRPLNGIDWTKAKEHPLNVSQAFDWATCPVRRIDAIELAKQSSRTHTMGLFANDALAKLDAPAESPEDANKQTAGGGAGGAGGTGMAGGAGGPGMGMAGTGMSGGPGGMSGGPLTPGGLPGMSGFGRGGGQPTNVTPNNQIDRDRYLQPPKEKDQDEKPSRHLPLALQLIVDQSHMHDVLVALANSRLRIQITQVDFQRFHGVIKPPEGEKDGNTLRTGPVWMPPGMGGMYGGAGGMRRPGGGGPMMPKMPGGMSGMPGGMSGMPGGMSGMPGGPMMPKGGMSGMPGGPMMPPGGGMSGMPMMYRPGAGGPMPPGIVSPTGGPMGPMGPMGGTDPKKAGATQEEENLLEVTIYGVATLYRKPDPPKTQEPLGQPGATPPVTPAGTTPAATTPAGTTPADEKKDDAKKGDAKKEEKKDDAKKDDAKKDDAKKDDAKKDDKKDEKPDGKKDEKAPDKTGPPEKKS